MNVVDRLRQPEYTGENRCVPCTVVNAAIAVGLAVAVGVTAVALGANQLAGGVAGVVVLGFSAGAIYFRGYLVPGTPWFTKTYFPDWLLRRFDKSPAAGGMGATADVPDDIDEFDVETVLARMGAVTECANVDDLCLTDEFRATWREEIEQLRSDGADSTADVDGNVAGLLDADPDDISVVERGESRIARVDGHRVGQWESRAALLADVAAANALRGHTLWDALTIPQRGRALQGLRIFVEQCPACDGPVELGEDVVESCCRSIDVVAVTCRDCGDRLFESEQVA